MNYDGTFSYISHQVLDRSFIALPSHEGNLQMFTWLHVKMLAVDKSVDHQLLDNGDDQCERVARIQWKDVEVTR